MTRSKIAIAMFTALTALSLTGCSSSAPAPTTAPAPASASATAATASGAAADAKKADPINQGLPSMKKATVDLRRALGSNDAAKTKAAVEAVAEAWEKFEDEVKAKDKDLYEKIETQLGVLKAGAKADKFDASPLKKAVGSLDGFLYTVDPAIAGDAVKSGAIAMTNQIAVLKDALAKNDGTAVQAAAEKVDGEWYVVEHDVKAKDADLYGKVEDPLKAIKSGVKQQPLDTKTLSDLTAKLEALVGTLTK